MKVCLALAVGSGSLLTAPARLNKVSNPLTQSLQMHQSVIIFIMEINIPNNRACQTWHNGTPLSFLLLNKAQASNVAADLGSSSLGTVWTSGPASGLWPKNDATLTAPL